MESELRKKFVVVTVGLMTLVMAIFYAAFRLYYRFWFDRDLLEFVEWMTDSVVLEAAEKGESFHVPLVAVIVSQDGVPLSQTVGNGEAEVSDDTVMRILSRRPQEYRYRSYLYTVRNLSDGRRLVVIMDTELDSMNPMRLLTRAVLLLLVGLMMMTVGYLLSRFVTKPAAEAMRREKQFVSDASHELKTPLGAISINAQALAGIGARQRTTESDSNFERHIQNILRESERMNRLVERLLTLARIEEENEVEKTVLSLSSCVEEMALTYESVAYEKGVDYDYEIAGDILIRGVEDDLRQLAAILIDNAIRHTKESGRVTVNLRRVRSSAELIVENTGEGIAPEALPHIFERFYQADASRSSGSFGLGLAIAKAIADRQGAVISVGSIPGDTTVFRVEFGSVAA